MAQTDLRQPIAAMKRNSTNTSPVPVETTLVDDPVALVDSSTALVGSQTTQIPALRVAAKNNAPNASVRKTR